MVAAAEFLLPVVVRVSRFNKEAVVPHDINSPRIFSPFPISEAGVGVHFHFCVSFDLDVHGITVEAEIVLLIAQQDVLMNYLRFCLATLQKASTLVLNVGIEFTGAKQQKQKQEWP